jgi:hypothetical protein
MLGSKGPSMNTSSLIQRAPLVSLTLVTNEKKSSIRKILIILFGHLWIEELTYILAVEVAL